MRSFPEGLRAFALLGALMATTALAAPYCGSKTMRPEGAQAAHRQDMQIAEVHRSKR